MELCKASWGGFIEFTENAITTLPISMGIIVGEHRFRKVIAAATVRFIPAGRIVEIRPYFSIEGTILANERDALR